MIGVPKVSLQLSRNKEITQCLESLATECDMPVALLTILGERLKYVRGKHAFSVQVSDVYYSFLSRTEPELYMLNHIQWPLPGTEQYKESMPTWLQFYAGLPLITSTGLFLGSICVMDHQPGRLSVSQQELLRQTADRILTLL
ncbi:hypothetical protein SAMN05421788_10244 [Filimonas lacunae]|uniref:GAF domain-containing protein n=1 Tax=Filimonas lacunae TaxID=477680 RepID=A0A173MI87_9BACT|nr:GAF domain-containing protein [Filimonas lacunae]BAV07334.1 hypothetical protein FLA_3357 [Filimonas lacunae]SIS91186.1 hypothetical protein SAMN05421788_10244 [Filimonas lacunae]